MRADRHYVDLLSARGPAARERTVAVAALETPAVSDVPALVPLIESIRQHGVLQPLLVNERGGQMRIISGQRRLAAAIAAGLREVPCLVHDVDEETAARIRAACDVAAVPLPEPPRTPSTEATRQSADEVARLLGTASSLAELLAGPVSDLSRGVVGTLLRAELWRASTLAQAAQVVRGELQPVRSAVPVAALLDRVAAGFAAERRIRHLDVSTQVDLPSGHVVVADDRMLSTALCCGLMLTTMLLEAAGSGRIVLIAGVNASRQLTLVVSQDQVVPPAVWAERAFDVEWIDRAGGAPAVVAAGALLRAARTHGGEATATISPKGSRIGLTIPAGA